MTQDESLAYHISRKGLFNFITASSQLLHLWWTNLSTVIKSLIRKIYIFNNTVLQHHLKPINMKNDPIND